MSILTSPEAVAARQQGQVVRIVEQGAREGGTTGHQATEGSGLRGHSCGDTFPFDYVTLGNGDHVLTRHGAPIVWTNGDVLTITSSREEARAVAAQFQQTGVLESIERVSTWAEVLS